jgi:chondroitin sulfate synthase
MQHIFHHNSSGNDAYTRDLLSREVLRAISLHPIKQHQYQYHMKNFLNQRKLIDLRQSLLRIYRDIFSLHHQLSTNEDTYDDDEIDYRNRFSYHPSFSILRTPRTRSKRHDYSFFTRSLFSSSYISPKRGLESYWKRSIGDLVRQVMDDINRNSIQRGRVIDFKDVLYGYMRHQPTIGIDYIIDILLVYRKYEGRKMTVTVRRHAYLRQTYSALIFREDTNVDSIFFHCPDEMIKLHMNQSLDASSSAPVSAQKDGILHNFFRLIYANKADSETEESLRRRRSSMAGFLRETRYNSSQKSSEFSGAESEIYSKTINFIVPLAGRLEIFKRFMENFEEVSLKNAENVNLAIILYVDENGKSVNEIVHATVSHLNKKYLTSNLKVIEVNGNFSRSVACEVGAASYHSTALIFFVDIDMIFTRDFLLRVRLNTIESKQVYFPIVFSEFDPSPSVVSGTAMRNPSKGHYDFTLDTGYWRQFGFGIVAAYNSDLRRVGGFDTSIIGWGKEDVDLYEKFIRSNITVFRSVDVGLVHVFHKIECDPNLASEQMIMCVASRATSIASQRTLTDLIYQSNLEKINVAPNFVVNASVVAEITTRQQRVVATSNIAKHLNNQQ